MAREVAMAQAVYYLVTGIWPFLNFSSFERVTGPKADRWLVLTVGSLVTVIGGTIGLAGIRDRVDAEAVLLATGSAASLAAVDITYASRGRISRAYYLDAILEVVLILAWGLALLRRPSPNAASSHSH